MKGAFRVFSTFFALLRIVPELSASFRALDDEEFFVIGGPLPISSWRHVDIKQSAPSI